MERPSKSSGTRGSATVSTASLKSKGKTFVVSNPLTPSQIDWLRQQSKSVAAASSLRSTLGVSRTPSSQAASIASKVLSDPNTSKSSKTVAASVLSRSTHGSYKGVAKDRRLSKG